MANIVIMPKQGLQMTEGLITKWLKNVGDTVKEGEPLFEMETDKLTITIDSSFTGTLLKIIRGEGEEVPITEPIALIGNPGDDTYCFLKHLDNGTYSFRLHRSRKGKGEEGGGSGTVRARDASGKGYASGCLRSRKGSRRQDIHNPEGENALRRARDHRLFKDPRNRRRRSYNRA